MRYRKRCIGMTQKLSLSHDRRPDWCGRLSFCSIFSIRVVPKTDGAMYSLTASNTIELIFVVAWNWSVPLLLSLCYSIPRRNWMLPLEKMSIIIPPTWSRMREERTNWVTIFLYVIRPQCDPATVYFSMSNYWVSAINLFITISRRPGCLSFMWIFNVRNTLPAWSSPRPFPFVPILWHGLAPWWGNKFSLLGA